MLAAHGRTTEEKWDFHRINPNSLISEMLCVPLPLGGQALVELHLKHRILPDDSVPYSRKRRVKHTFIVRDQGQDIKFEVFARRSVVPKGREGACLRGPKCRDNTLANLCFAP